MSTGFISDLLQKCNQHKLEDHRKTLYNLIESVLYQDARIDVVRSHIDDLWVEIEADITELSEPPNEEQLGLLHPTFDV